MIHLLRSVLQTACWKGGFDPVDQLERYCRWWKEGYLSSTGTCLISGQQLQQPFPIFYEPIIRILDRPIRILRVMGR